MPSNSCLDFMLTKGIIKTKPMYNMPINLASRSYQKDNSPRNIAIKSVTQMNKTYTNRNVINFLGKTIFLIIKIKAMLKIKKGNFMLEKEMGNPPANLSKVDNTGASITFAMKKYFGLRRETINKISTTTTRSAYII